MIARAELAIRVIPARGLIYRMRSYPRTQAAGLALTGLETRPASEEPSPDDTIRLGLLFDLGWHGLGDFLLYGLEEMGEHVQATAVMAFQKFAVRPSVVFNENSGARSKCSPESRLGFDFRTLRRLEEHLEVKPAALSFFTLHPDLASHQFYESFRDGQPKTRATKPSRRGRIRLRESAKNLLLICPRDAYARV